jgi:hypothetical protein
MIATTYHHEIQMDLLSTIGMYLHEKIKKSKRREMIEEER